ncbi:MAG TPA: hypothetical protein VGN13_12350 [Solirubrobacteraceae bacterium]|jgi:uncharacterized membrane protein YeaQ/YmgE (transglycosylase-associated protein family)
MSASLRLKLQASSLNATILAIVTALAGMVAGLGVIDSAQQGLIVAATTGGIAAAGLIANAIHSGKIEPSAIVTSIIVVAGQVVSLVVSFALIDNQEAGTIISIVTAVVGAAAVIAHALVSRQTA